MCREASFVISRNRIFWSRESDSHEDIIQEFGLVHLDTDPPGFVRVELTPLNNDFRLPISEWKFRVDQDIVPDWWNPEWGEEQVRETAIDWLACKVLLPGQIIKELRDKIFTVYGTVQEVWGGGTVIAYTHLSPSILKSPNAVLVDRSCDVVRCYTGIQNEP